VTPGWVDVHTHYDGQATWDPLLAPSSWHGVTTVVMGNCGVGFAPVRPGQEQYLIELMEGVEDIPGSALAEGIDWQWESFPEYLDALEKQPRAIDIGTQVPHGAVRAYVMGARCNTQDDVPTNEELAEMQALVREGIQAGALGFSSSRTWLHKDKHGVHVPGTFAGSDEMLALGLSMSGLNHGVFELVSDHLGDDDEWAWVQAFARETGRPVTLVATSAVRSQPVASTSVTDPQPPRTVHSGAWSRTIEMEPGPLYRRMIGMPLSSAVASTTGLKDEPDCRPLPVARL